LIALAGQAQASSYWSRFVDSILGTNRDKCAEQGGPAQTACERECVDEYKECKFECVNDSLCDSECLRKYTTCESNCPCYENCPTGCPCPYWTCPCELIDGMHKEHENCKDEAADKHEKCEKLCNPNDALCHNVCTLQFSNDLSNCPCGTGCPLGCPCDFYDCDGKWPPHTTPQPTTSGITQTTRADPSKVIPFLVTNSYANPQSFSFSWQQYEGQPVIDNMLGMVYEPGVRVEGTCSLLYNGTMYILGGPPNSQDATQLLKVNKCTVQRFATLNYPMNGCNAMNYIATELDPWDNPILVEKYIVCGSFEDPTQCYGFDPTQYQGILLDESEYPNKMSVSHYGGDMVNFKDQPFVVAGRDTLIAETLVTLADGDPGWRATEKIPGLKQRAFLSAVTFQNQVWAFGGRDSRVDMADVYVYNGRWTHWPQKMANGHRYGHRSIVDRNSIYHIGGHIGVTGTKKVPIERWLYTGAQNFTITSSAVRYDDLYQYPEVFMMDPPYSC